MFINGFFIIPWSSGDTEHIDLLFLSWTNEKMTQWTLFLYIMIPRNLLHRCIQYKKLFFLYHPNSKYFQIIRKYHRLNDFFNSISFCGYFRWQKSIWYQHLQLWKIFLFFSLFNQSKPFCSVASIEFENIVRVTISYYVTMKYKTFMSIYGNFKILSWKIINVKKKYEWINSFKDITTRILWKECNLKKRHCLLCNMNV